FLFEPSPHVPAAESSLTPAEIADLCLNRTNGAKLMLPAVDQLDATVTREKCRQSALLTMLALQLYRREHAEFPPELDSLIESKSIAELPSDPCAAPGQPLCYRRTETEAFIWSVGPHGEFEHVDDFKSVDDPNLVWAHVKIAAPQSTDD